MLRKCIQAAVVCLLLLAMPLCSASAVTVGGGTVSGNNVRLRTGADTSGADNVIKQLNQGTFLLVEEKLDGWYKVVCDGTAGYVSAAYVSFADTLDGAYVWSAKTAGSNVNLRKSASTAGAVVKNLAASGTGLTVLGVSGQWLRVRDVFGAEGYIRSDYVSYVSDGTAAAVPQGTGELLARSAKGYVGYAYRWGGMSPKTGFDCSGFVNYIYDQYGCDLDRTAQSIYSNNGTAVTKDSLQPGDVLCFGWGPYSITHVGIYLGDGQMVHASTSATGVIISDINSAYYTRMFVGAKRILE